MKPIVRQPKESLGIDFMVPTNEQASPLVRSVSFDDASELQLTSWSPPETQVLSLPLASPKVKCKYFQFQQPEWKRKRQPAKPAGDTTVIKPKAKSGGGKSTSKQRTTIRPPEDVVKLQDRLFYVLQPPLESILGDEELTLPFEPFPYQYSGISFLYPRHCAVLADEMGLGKTMQAITTTRLLLHSNEIQSVILVCPKPLISNWQREFAQWAEEIPVTVIRGSSSERRFAWQRNEFAVKITNYESLLRDADLIDEGIVSADLVVLDEAQRIKNSNSSTSEVVRTIPRRRSWALTGTPIENSTDDLVGIFEFLAPGTLYKGMTPKSMASATSDHIIRRTKDDVMTDLPPKLFRDAALELSPDQALSYQMAEGEGIVQLSELGKSLTIQHVFELVLRLKQICNFDPATGNSSKLDRLKADLEEVAQSGKKAIVFSQWVDTLERLNDELSQFSPLQYHGRISPAIREQVIQDFRESDEHTVLLISYGAGSVGLNLQFTNYVFLYDRWWNPAIEDQAINRAHRIGSSGPVTVTRFVTPGTIEQRIDDILREKRELMHAILGAQDGPRQMGLSQDEIFGLFDLRFGKAA